MNPSFSKLGLTRIKSSKMVTSFLPVLTIMYILYSTICDEHTIQYCMWCTYHTVQCVMYIQYSAVHVMYIPYSTVCDVHTHDVHVHQVQGDIHFGFGQRSFGIKSGRTAKNFVNTVSHYSMPGHLLFVISIIVEPWETKTDLEQRLVTLCAWRPWHFEVWDYDAKDGLSYMPGSRSIYWVVQDHIKRAISLYIAHFPVVVIVCFMFLPFCLLIWAYTFQHTINRVKFWQKCEICCKCYVNLLHAGITLQRYADVCEAQKAYQLPCEASWCYYGCIYSILSLDGSNWR